MTHFKSYLKHKAYQTKKYFRRHYEYPQWIVWIWIIVASAFVSEKMHTEAMICFALAFIYYMYCDYSSGADIGWERKKWKRYKRGETNGTS